MLFRIGSVPTPARGSQIPETCGRIGLLHSLSRRLASFLGIRPPRFPRVQVQHLLLSELDWQKRPLNESLPEDPPEPPPPRPPRAPYVARGFPPAVPPPAPPPSLRPGGRGGAGIEIEDGDDGEGHRGQGAAAGEGGGGDEDSPPGPQPEEEGVAAKEEALQVHLKPARGRPGLDDGPEGGGASPSLPVGHDDRER